MNCRNFNFYGANLRRANLAGVDLTGANMMYADLTGADLTGAWVRYANLSFTKLNYANSPDSARVYRATIAPLDQPAAALTDVPDTPFLKVSASHQCRLDYLSIIR
jgi:hypothetical protein